MSSLPRASREPPVLPPPPLQKMMSEAQGADELTRLLTRPRPQPGADTDDWHCSQAFADVFGALSHKNLASIFFPRGLLHFSQPGSENGYEADDSHEPMGCRAGAHYIFRENPNPSKGFRHVPPASWLSGSTLGGET
ncbi:hypothetical protein D623_10014294 [Myotis brandtii]|uniref:Uncharacterized protein n=1 Tax=Myotis brandtii TaxID=109478 RepID=S7Q169_MYOBR|nr:hypothetical protein D623_10014294 [Myotis brandtii]